MEVSRLGAGEVKCRDRNLFADETNKRLELPLERKRRLLVAAKEAKMAECRSENRELFQMQESMRNWLSLGRHTISSPQLAFASGFIMEHGQEKRVEELAFEKNKGRNREIKV